MNPDGRLRINSSLTQYGYIDKKGIEFWED